MNSSGSNNNTLSERGSGDCSGGYEDGDRTQHRNKREGKECEKEKDDDSDEDGYRDDQDEEYEEEEEFKVVIPLVCLQSPTTVASKKTGGKSIWSTIVKGSIGTSSALLESSVALPHDDTVRVDETTSPKSS